MKKVLMFLVISAMILPAITAASIDTNLKYGARGNEVFELQEFLNGKGFLSSAATGNFYSLTLKAVIAYQASVGLPTSGFVGQMTRNAINQELADGISTQAEITETGTTTPPITESPIDLLKKQVALLMQQIQVLQGQATTQNQILQNQQAQQAAQNQQAQQTQQQLGQIITNTTPIVAPAPTPTPAPTQTPTVRFDQYSQQTASLGTHDWRISWQSSYMQSCSASGAWDGSKPTNGEVLVSFNQVGTFTYSLACTGLTGGTKNATLTITVVDTTPKIFFLYNGSESVSNTYAAKVGDTVRLGWYTRYSGGSCTASGDWSGEKIEGNSENLTFIQAGTFNYILTCTGRSGEKGTGTASVTVTP